jgi:hypothetical protein
MQGFNFDEYMRKSTEQSGVSIRVKGKQTLSAIAALINRR